MSKFLWIAISDVVSVPQLDASVWRLRPFFWFLNDRRQLTNARFTFGSNREVPAKTFTPSAASLLPFHREQNMTRFNVLRPQIDIMTLPSASAPPHLGRGMILLSATFIEMKLQSFLSPAGAERRRYQLLFDVT